MNCTCSGDRLGHPGSWTCTCSDESYYAPSALKKLETENARLRSQLEATKSKLKELEPKPVVEVKYVRWGINIGLSHGASQLPQDNLKLTFEDGELVGAEVINDDKK